RPARCTWTCATASSPPTACGSAWPAPRPASTPPRWTAPRGAWCSRRARGRSGSTWPTASTRCATTGASWSRSTPPPSASGCTRGCTPTSPTCRGWTRPTSVPLWAFRQLEDLKYVRRFVQWWIEQRQVEYGDFGGGISDDSDLVQQWPGLALMGVMPDRINASLTALAEAVYRNGMFTDGLSTIETDELHAYEEGINSNSAMLYLNWGDPLTVERLMETVKAFDERIILPNPQGHLLFSSNWFGGNKVYRDPNWQWQKP